jgi:hypothetical protein
MLRKIRKLVTEPINVRSLNQDERILLILSDSGLFVEKWYLRANQDVKDSGLSALEHYYFNGYQEGRQPCYLFDPLWYLENNLDVKNSGIEPLTHYVLFGDAEDRQPSIYFDPKYYREQVDLSSDTLALSHFLANISSGVGQPLPAFNVKYYLDENKDIAKKKVDPYEHFLLQGQVEGRNPNANFDSLWYGKEYLKGVTTDRVFTHYLQEGVKAGLATNMMGLLKQELRDSLLIKR